MPIGILTEQEKARLEQAVRIAGVAVIELITTECVKSRQKASGALLYDTRPMLDTREHSPAIVDWHAEMLAYGLAAGVLQRDSADHHLVKFVRAGH